MKLKISRSWQESGGPWVAGQGPMVADTPNFSAAPGAWPAPPPLPQLSCPSFPVPSAVCDFEAFEHQCHPLSREPQRASHYVKSLLCPLPCVALLQGSVCDVCREVRQQHQPPKSPSILQILPVTSPLPALSALPGDSG